MVFEGMTFGPYDKAEQKARKAFELYENGEISQALLEIEEALQINPSNSAWHFDKALALDTEGKFNDAIGEYEIALDLSPSDSEILNSLAVDYTRTGQYDLAISIFERVQHLDSDFEPCYCNRIITYAEMQKHDLAEEMFYLAQQINPNCALCYYNIGNSLFIRGLYSQASRCWLRTAELEPTHPQINYRIAQAYWFAGDTHRAREYFLTELRINPADIEVILDFGTLLLEIGDVESAKEKFNRTLEIAPGAQALFYLGEICFEQGDYDNAVLRFNQALESDQELKGPRFRLAQYMLTKHKQEEARDYLVSEMALVPEEPNILVSIGSMFLVIGDLDLAEHCMIRANEFDSANVQGYYYRGLINALKGRFENAAQFFTHALDVHPEHIFALRDSAYVYLMMGQLSDAAERIEKAIELAGEDSDIRTLSRKIRTAKLTRKFKKFFRFTRR